MTSNEATFFRGLTSRTRPVLYNSWEATFSVNEAGQKLLADKAAKLGVELFVIDDGWFGKRNNDHAGLGDWFVNPEKFPQGLNGLIGHVNRLGMDFGLWVEPEMVNADSDLYRKHPDWVMNFPGRPRSEQRNQMVLNLARDDVKEYLVQRSGQACHRLQNPLFQMGHEPLLLRTGLAGGACRRTTGALGEIHHEPL